MHVAFVVATPGVAVAAVVVVLRAVAAIVAVVAIAPAAPAAAIVLALAAIAVASVVLALTLPVAALAAFAALASLAGFAALTGLASVVGLRRRRLGRGGSAHGLLRVLLIVVHSASSPSPVTEEIGSTGQCRASDHACSASVRSARESLSTFVATTM